MPKFTDASIKSINKNHQVSITIHGGIYDEAMGKMIKYGERKNVRNTCARRSARNGGSGGKKLRKAMENLEARQRAWEGSKYGRKPGSMKI